MASQTPNPSSPPPPPVAVVVSRYNRTITDSLKRAAIAEYTRRGGELENLAVIEAPGAFELPAIADAAAESGLYKGVCCLGCVIKGETSHDEHLNAAVAQGLMAISLRLGVPATFGVLTTSTVEQAQARAGGDVGNKGTDAMAATLDAIAAIDAIRQATDIDKPGLTFELGRDPADKADDSTTQTPAGGGDS